MPSGKPKPQTVASKKYQDKAGWISKSYKLKRDIAEQYAEACRKANVSQAGQLMKMMKEFTDKMNAAHSECSGCSLLLKKNDRTGKRIYALVRGERHT